MDNGPSRDLLGETDMLEEAVYCVDCGNIFVWGKGRDCPACHLAERMEGGE